MITIQKYVRAGSLEEAWQLNQNKRNRILGGMLWLRLGKGSVGTAIDLGDLGLDTIEENEHRIVRDFSPEEQAQFTALLSRAITNMGGSPCRRKHKEEDTQ